MRSVVATALLLGAALFLGAWTAGVGAKASPALAPQSLSLKSISCETDASVSADFTWAPADAHWLDVSRDAEFSGWMNAYVGDVFALVQPYTLGGLSADTRYFARTSTPSSDGWLRSNVVSFTTPSCTLSASGELPSLTFLGNSCTADGRVRATFSWSPPSSRSFWLDISRDSRFRGWANTRIAPGTSLYAWTGLREEATYFARLASAEGQRSNQVRFSTPRCSSTLGAVGTSSSTGAEAGRSLLEDFRVVAYYGHPLTPNMGVLGTGSMQTVYDRLRQQGAGYRTASQREVKLAFHLVYAVAQSSPGPGGLYLYRTDARMVQALIDFTRDRDMLLILDLQNGHADVEAEVARVLPYLLEPHVHLALDPEFTMGPGQVPGISIGSIDGRQINAVQRMLSEYVSENSLSNKILIVHQFLDSMVTNKHLVDSYPGVDLVYDMDGFGGSGAKLSKYQRYVVQAPTQYGAIKLFYNWDVGLMSPSVLLGLDPPPDIVIYQ